MALFVCFWIIAQFPLHFTQTHKNNNSNNTHSLREMADHVPSWAKGGGDGEGEVEAATVPGDHSGPAEITPSHHSISYVLCLSVFLSLLLFVSFSFFQLPLFACTAFVASLSPPRPLISPLFLIVHSEHAATQDERERQEDYEKREQLVQEQQVIIYGKVNNFPPFPGWMRHGPIKPCCHVDIKHEIPEHGRSMVRWALRSWEVRLLCFLLVAIYVL